MRDHKYILYLYNQIKNICTCYLRLGYFGGYIMSKLDMYCHVTTSCFSMFPNMYCLLDSE